ncbi:MAG: hypothetical protein AAB776_03320 [Patescibacteria group bacterium]
MAQQNKSHSVDWRSWNYSRMRANDILPAPIPDWLQDSLGATPEAIPSDVTGIDLTDRPR